MQTILRGRETEWRAFLALREQNAALAANLWPDLYGVWLCDRLAGYVRPREPEPPALALAA